MPPARKTPPRRRRTIQVRVTMPELALIASWAKAKDITHSEVVRELIELRARLEREATLASMAPTSTSTSSRAARAA